MSYEELESIFVELYGAEKSTMMGTPCLRYKGKFFAMMFERENALVIKLPERRVNELIEDKKGHAFNFTKKRFKEWILIPESFKDDYEDMMIEALNYAK